MLIRTAQKKDIGSWLALAKQVSPLFGVKDMSKDENFIKYIKRKIDKSEAIAAAQKISGDAFGFIGFSKKNNAISWFAVDEKHRGEGAGSKLLHCAIGQLDKKKDISVITFRKGHPGGEAAIGLYEKFGFKAEDTAVEDGKGNERCKMVLKAGAFHKPKMLKFSFLQGRD
jgi:GNAT superfamily N-acetyltransferase